MNPSARIWLDAVFNAKEGADKLSAGNMALTRAGFNKGNSSTTKKDGEVWAMEEALLKNSNENLKKVEKAEKVMV